MPRTSAKDSINAESLNSNDTFICPSSFYQKYYQKGTRPCGRKLYAFRTIACEDLHKGILRESIMSSTTPLTISSIRLRAGGTQVHATVDAYLIYDDAPKVQDEDDPKFANVTVDLPKQIANYVYDKNGPCINSTHQVAHLLESILNSPECLQENQLAFHLMLENVQDSTLKKLESFLRNKRARYKFDIKITFEAYDGNILDFSFAACNVALKRAKLPIVVVHKCDDTGVYSIRLLHGLVLKNISDPLIKVSVLFQ
ncbi:bifunctional PNPase-RNase PH domain superfamily/Exoribonuclease [Babesia duncani]|uniref:Bifunctional PNPase-RNase PH domain superfamily/Exoribonuclease n=1 Tax=Babesia duncani TaxID=323732 RepID=A0AAD9UM94_9APIC|nr:bifunctional PNPase-RNase PH domain superfamily/Exoribonuclease [Babesia duncani]